MSSTPERNEVPPPKTPGWSAALFGIWSTAKKPRHAVDSSTEPPTSVSRPAHNGSSRRMEIALASPSERNSVAASNHRNGVTYSTTQAPSAIDLLDTENPSVSSPPVEPSLAFAQKSPWKVANPSNMNGNSNVSVPIFSPGVLKPPPSSTGTATRRRKGYTPSVLLRNARRRKAAPFDSANAVTVLRQSQTVFEPSNRSLQARRNYTSFRAGTRLLGSSQRGGSRLTQETQHDDNSNEQPPIKRRKKVMFESPTQVDGSTTTMPVVSDMVTPVKSATKRTSTPYKASQPSSTEKGDPMDTFEQTPTKRKPLKTRSDPKVFLDKGAYVLQDPDEVDCLGDPVPSRTPIFTLATNLGPKFARIPSTKRKKFEDEGAAKTLPPVEKPKAPVGGPSIETSLRAEGAGDLVSPANSTQVTGWGNLFAHQKTLWKCASCMTQNEKDKYKCAACEAPRPGYEDKKQSKEANSSSSGAIGTTGFSFGSSIGTATSTPGTTGGFKFGASSEATTSSGPAGFTAKPAPSTAAAPASSTVGFTFGSSSASTQAPAPGGFTSGVTPAPAPPPASGFSFGSNSDASVKTNHVAFSFGSNAPTSAPSSKDAEENPIKPIGFSFASPPAPAKRDQPFKFDVSGKDKAAETPKPSFSFGAATDTQAKSTEPTAKRTRATENGNSPLGSEKGASTESSSAKPAFSFGAPSGGFTFGNSSASAPVSTSSTPPLPLGSIPSKETKSEEHSKRQRGDEDDNTRSTLGNASKANGTPSVMAFGSSSAGDAGSSGGTSAPVFNFGGSSTSGSSVPFKFGAGAATSNEKNAVQAGQSLQTSVNSTAISDSSSKLGNVSTAPAASNLFGGTGTSSTPPAASGKFSFGGAPTFGSTPAAVDSTPAATPAGPAFGATPKEFSSAQTPAPAFGSTSVQSFGSAQASTQPSFGASSTPGPAAPALGATQASAPPTFGSTPAHAASAPMFGSTSAQAPAAPTFGSTPAQPPAPPAFGSASAQAPAPPAFGSTSAQTPAFGSTPAHSSAAPAFGTTPGPTPGAPFGSTSAQTPAAPAFGSAVTPGAPAFGATPGQANAPFGSAPAAPFGAVPAPAPFGAAPGAPSFGQAPAPAPFGGGFGNASAPAPFGGNSFSSTPAPAPFGGSFGGAPAPAATGFGGTFGSAQPPVATGPGGFGSGAQPSFGGGAANGGVGAPQGEVQFSLGTGGGQSSKTPGRRRIVRAKRPGSRPA